MIKLTAFVALLLCIAIFAVSAATNTYDVNRALDGVYYSKVAYCDMDTVAAWNCPVCSKFPGVTSAVTAQVEDKSSSAFVTYDQKKNQITIAFRGTVSFGGWIEDFDFFKTEYDPKSGCGPDCKVHQGLYWGYLELMEKLMPVVQQHLAAHPDADINCYGHSMGAAQAGFCQADMLLRFGNVTKGDIVLYDFGSPRIGNAAFVKWQQTILKESSSHRCTNLNDPVPLIPPATIDLFDQGRWIHNPREIFYKDAFGSPMDYKICADNYTHEDPTCSDSTNLFDVSFRYHTTYLGIGMGCFL